MVSPGKLIYYNGNAAYYSHRPQVVPSVLQPHPFAVCFDCGAGSQDRTACSVCRFVRKPKKKEKREIFRERERGMYNNCGKAARTPSHHENLQRPRVKVVADKNPSYWQQQAREGERERDTRPAVRRCNNNVETMAKVYILLDTVKISCFMCALDVNSRPLPALSVPTRIPENLQKKKIKTSHRAASSFHSRAPASESRSLWPGWLAACLAESSPGSTQFWQSALAAFHHSCTLF